MIRGAAVAGLAVLVASAAVAAGASAADSWIFSETQSPLDYAPVIIASAWSNADMETRAMQLSIQCRRGRTDLVILSPSLAGRLEGARVSYSIDGAPPLPLAVNPAPAGTGLAIKGDVVRLLTGLPAKGELAFHVTPPHGEDLDGHWDLAAMGGALGRLAAPCKWPARTP